MIPIPLNRKKTLWSFAWNLAPHDISNPEWQDAAVRVSWSNPYWLTQERWISLLTRDDRASRNMLEDTLIHMRMPMFFTFFPMELYYQKWPQMRLWVSPNTAKFRGVYDIAWSILAGGVSFIPPLQEWFELDNKDKNNLIRICSQIKPTKADSEEIQKLIKLGFVQEYAQGEFGQGSKHRYIFQDQGMPKNAKMSHTKSFVEAGEDVNGER